ncbi:uncharacterized protein LOC101863162, partial [Aplysia californica]|uniref:Uncharacterized protein LOC101863162 n=1 Tax=Aplysia californica TaxID=6500 RepID=A0ABM0KB93_APLCA
CPVYAELPSYCKLILPQGSNCCKEPVCTVNGKNVTGEVPIGTVQTKGGSSAKRDVNPTTGKGICNYKGQPYPAGATWFDGCDFSCSCAQDGSYYTCVSRCPSYPASGAVSANCQTVTVPGQCCPVLHCDIPGVGKYSPVPDMLTVPVVPPPKPGQPGKTASGLPQIWLVPGVNSNKPTLPGGGYVIPSTSPGLTGLRDKCVYSNHLYDEGDTWYAGCDLICTCLDAFTGHYTCDHECPTFEAKLLPSGCSLVQSGCCQMPTCRMPNGTVFDPVAKPEPTMPVVNGVGGGFTGTKLGFTGNSSFISGARNGCVFKTKFYNTGDKWSDGCEHECECVDGNIGLYKCIENCVKYENVPPNCQVVDVPNECCKTVSCKKSLPITLATTTLATTTLATTTLAPTTTPVTSASPTSVVVTTATMMTSSAPCSDVAPNCQSYGPSACKAPYLEWAKINCALTCGICQSSTTPATVCEDLENCQQYGANVCTDFQSWSEINCKRLCGYCGNSAITVTTPPMTTQSTAPRCVDKLQCDEYGPYICTQPDYSQWVLQNCQAYCSLCQASTPNSAVKVTPMTSFPGWTMLLKGVSGVPGDLAQLWSTNNT